MFVQHPWITSKRRDLFYQLISMDNYSQKKIPIVKTSVRFNNNICIYSLQKNKIYRAFLFSESWLKQLSSSLSSREKAMLFEFSVLWWLLFGWLVGLFFYRKKYIPAWSTIWKPIYTKHTRIRYLNSVSFLQLTVAYFLQLCISFLSWRKILSL